MQSQDEAEWLVHADCRREQYHPDWWYADLDDSDLPKERAERQILRAKLICASCPVRGACLMQAATTKEEFGVWGGYTADERQRLTHPTKPVTVRSPSDEPLTEVERIVLTAFVEERKTTKQIQEELHDRGVKVRVSEVVGMLVSRTYRLGDR
jgi:WhiB family transcriptional regulator, redox-sensing transcriptional regulator